MNHWLENSVKNLLPLSKAVDFQEALTEWFFTGEVDDYEWEEAEIICELCEHPDLIHHFHIKNAHNGNSLLVGSSCILKFQQIEIRDEVGRAVVDPSLRKKALEAALRKQVLESSLVPVRKLWKLDKPRRNQIEFLAAQIKRDRGLSPRQLLDLISYFEAQAITYSARLYKLNLRSDEASWHVTQMSSRDFQRIAPALSGAQKEKARKLRRDA
jgi:hypothetical protein